MPYADPERQREYQREWLRKRRDEYMRDKACAKCGSMDRLELDHKDPAQKLHHSIWSWSQARREAELAKCWVLCKTCHAKKTWRQRSGPFPHGTRRGYDRGCKCDPCMKASAAYRRARYKPTGRRPGRPSKA